FGYRLRRWLLRHALPQGSHSFLIHGALVWGAVGAAPQTRGVYGTREVVTESQDPVGRTLGLECEETTSHSRAVGCVQAPGIGRMEADTARSRRLAAPLAGAACHPPGG